MPHGDKNKTNLKIIFAVSPKQFRKKTSRQICLSSGRNRYAKYFSRAVGKQCARAFVKGRSGCVYIITQQNRFSGNHFLINYLKSTL